MKFAGFWFTLGMETGGWFVLCFQKKGKLGLCTFYWKKELWNGARFSSLGCMFKQQGACLSNRYLSYLCSVLCRFVVLCFEITGKNQVWVHFIGEKLDNGARFSSPGCKKYLCGLDSIPVLCPLYVSQFEGCYGLFYKVRMLQNSKLVVS